MDRTAHSAYIFFENVILNDYWAFVCLDNDRADWLILLNETFVVKWFSWISDLLEQVITDLGDRIANFEIDLTTLIFKDWIGNCAGRQVLRTGLIFKNQVVLNVSHVLSEYTVLNLNRAIEPFNIQDEAAIIIRSEHALKEFFSAIPAGDIIVILNVRKDLQRLLISQVLKVAIFDPNKWDISVVWHRIIRRSVLLIGEFEVIWFILKCNVLWFAIRNHSFAEFWVLETTALNIYSSTPVLTDVRQELACDLSCILRLGTFLGLWIYRNQSLNGHLDEIIGFDLDECLFVMEVLEITIVKIERRSMGSIAPDCIKRIEIEKHFVSLGVVVMLRNQNII